METGEEILKELKELAPRLASLEKANNYQLPEGYFETFAGKMLMQIKPVDAKQELNALAPLLSKLARPGNPELPATYFKGFAGSLIERVRKEDVAVELAAIAPKLAAIEKVNTITAPAGYFNGFADRVLADIKSGEEPVATQGNWIDGFNAFLDGIINAIFQPRYTFAFAGLTTTVIVGVLMMVKVEQCNDLDCRFAQLSTDEINNYLDNHSDAYSDEVFEMNLDNKGLENVNAPALHPYKDALKNVDDAALDAAIAD